MKPRWEVIYEHVTAYAGMGTGEENSERARTQHRTYLGAEYHRRFRSRHPTMGMRWIVTYIVRPEPHVPYSDNIEIAKSPRYAVVLERVMWPAVYWLRSRWDGLRHGVDRDASRW